MFKGNFHVRVGSTSIVIILTDRSSKHCLICRTSFRIWSFCEKVASASASSRHLGNYWPPSFECLICPDGPVRPATICHVLPIFPSTFQTQNHPSHQRATPKDFQGLKTFEDVRPYGAIRVSSCWPTSHDGLSSKVCRSLSSSGRSLDKSFLRIPC